MDFTEQKNWISQISIPSDHLTSDWTWYQLMVKIGLSGRGQRCGLDDLISFQGSPLQIVGPRGYKGTKGDWVRSSSDDTSVQEHESLGPTPPFWGPARAALG